MSRSTRRGPRQTALWALALPALSSGALAAPPAAAEQAPETLPMAEAPKESLNGLARCKDQPWLNGSESPSDGLYATGVGASLAAAQESALAGLARQREVTVRQISINHQVDWHATDSARVDSAVHTEDHLERHGNSYVEGRFQGCAVADSCIDANDRVHARVRCSLPGREMMEDQLTKVGADVAGRIPRGASVIVIPGFNEDGYITELGEYAAMVLRQAIDRKLPETAKLRVLPKWDPRSLYEVARKAKATHAIWTQHLAAGGAHVRFEASILSLDNGQRVPRSESSFEMSLDPDQSQMMATRGPLFPNKDALALSANRGRPAQLNLAKLDLQEGEEVQLSFTLPVDSYVYLFDIYEDGRAALLLPNPTIGDNHAVAGKHYVLPDDAWRAHRMKLIVCPMLGHGVSHETIKLVASTKPLDLDFTRFTGPDMVTLEGTPQGKLSEVRTLLDRLEAAGERIYEGSASYQVHAVPEKTRCKAAALH